MSIVKSDLPALWNLLSIILKFEKTTYLHQDISNIVKKLIKMRTAIYDNSAQRSNDDYVPWEDPDKA